MGPQPPKQGDVARTATVYRLNIDLSDVDRGKYESLEFRVAQHPSESVERLVTRILAYVLLHEERLEFGRGVSDADEPALWTHDLTGQLAHWIDVGAPSAPRIHAASKRAQRVTIVCHKGRDSLLREMSGKRVHDAQHIEVLYLESSFVSELAGALDRNAKWGVLFHDGHLSVTIGEQTWGGLVEREGLPG